MLNLFSEVASPILDNAQEAAFPVVIIVAILLLKPTPAN